MKILSVSSDYAPQPEDSVITISRIRDSACPLRYFKEYIERPRSRRPFDSIELGLGKVFHAAAAEHFRRIRDRGTPIEATDTLDVPLLLARFREELLSEGRLRAPYKIVQAHFGPEEFLQRLERVAIVFDEVVAGKLAGHTVLDIDGRFEVSAELFCLRGKYDLITRQPDGDLVLWDWKTGRPPASAEDDPARIQRVQLGFYTLWMKHKFENTDVSARAVFLRDGCQELSERFSPALESEVLRYADGWRDRQNAQTSYPPRLNDLCDWCGWNPVCSAYRKRPLPPEPVAQRAFPAQVGRNPSSEQASKDSRDGSAADSVAVDVVTGAFGYTGKYIAQQLLAAGKRVKTLTGHPDRENPFGERVSVSPFSFEDPQKLREALAGATTLYNTYWVRFPRGKTTYDLAVANTMKLLRAAEEAGVRRIVHISITNPSEDSPFPYFRGKAILERAIEGSRLSYAILRPAVIFGDEGILIHNIAWFLGRFPIFAIPGKGDYRLQPIFVEDLAELAVRLGSEDGNRIVDAVGPETFTFEELVRLVAEKVGRRARMVHLPPGLALLLSRLAGLLVGDVVLTRDEVDGLMANLLVSEHPPTGKTRLSDWLERNKDRLGIEYQSELARHYR